MNEMKEQIERKAEKNGCLGCNLIETSPVTLRTGLTVCTSCPDWRIETEARHIVNMESKKMRTEYLTDVEKQRGKAAADILRDEVRAQWVAKAPA